MPAEAARRLYAASSAKTRLRQRLRLSVCPFEEIVARVPAGSRVLDVGCGEGLLLALLSDAGRVSSAVGFDSNPAAIRRARRMAEANGLVPAIEFRNLGIDSTWLVEGGLFDVVTMIDVMHHLPKAKRGNVWEQAAAVLRPGGLMIYKDMARSPSWAALANRVHDLIFYADWIHYADLDGIARLARAGGLVERRREFFSRLWYRHEMAVFERIEKPAIRVPYALRGTYGDQTAGHR